MAYPWQELLYAPLGVDQYDCCSCWRHALPGQPDDEGAVDRVLQGARAKVEHLHPRHRDLPDELLPA
eukprot:3442038-Pyramimonas_sp.AAC.1